MPDDPLRDDPLGLDGEDVLGESADLRPSEPDVAADRPVEPAPPRLDGPTSAISLDDRPTTYFSPIIEPAATPATAPGLRSVLAPWAVFGVVGVLLIAATSTWASWLRGPAGADDAPFPTFEPMATATSPAPAPPEAIAQPPTPTPTVEPEPEPTRRTTEQPRPTQERAPAVRSQAPAPPSAASESGSSADESDPAAPGEVATEPSAGPDSLAADSEDTEAPGSSGSEDDDEDDEDSD